MSKAWKAFERELGRRLGTYRTPLSGSNSRHTQSDTLHKDYYIEAKYFSRDDSPFRPIYNLVRKSNIPLSWTISRKEVYVIFHTYYHNCDATTFEPITMTPHQRRWSIWRFFQKDVMKKAREEDKLPVLAIKKRARKGEVIICRLEDYLYLAAELSKEYK